MKKRNVLMLEDDPDDRYITDKYLVDKGYDIKVDFFPSGEEDIIRYLKSLDNSRMPHLILMSGKYGLDLLKALKQHDLFRQIPVVVLTEMSHGFSIHQAYGLGANSVIEKPSTHQLTKNKIDAFLQYWFSTVELPVTTMPDPD